VAVTALVGNVALRGIAASAVFTFSAVVGSSSVVMGAEALLSTRLSSHREVRLNTLELVKPDARHFRPLLLMLTPIHRIWIGPTLGLIGLPSRGSCRQFEALAYRTPTFVERLSDETGSLGALRLGCRYFWREG
jgi:hypothetical protein